MNTNIEVLRELDELVEAARLLGVTQAKKLFGCYTDEDRRFERAMYESIDKHRAALLDWEAALPSAPVGVDFAAVASILRRALRDGAHYGYRRDFILQQALALEALSQQPAAMDAGLAQRIQALVGGVEVDLEAPLSADANATSQTHGAMLRQLEPQLQEQLAESEHAAAAQAAEIDALRAEVERLRTDLMESDEIREKLGHLLTRTAAALKGEPPAGVWHSWHDLPEKAAQLVEALALLPDEIVMIEHNPDEGPLMFCCGRKVKLSWLHDLIPTHNEGCWYARMRAMRDHDKENRND